jgi:hypothetical protein
LRRLTAFGERRPYNRGGVTTTGVQDHGRH